MHVLSGPRWFLGFDYSFEIIAFLITLFIAFYSLRIFLLAWDRKYLYVTLAFLSISASYASRAAMDWFIYRDLLPSVPNLAKAVSTVVQVNLLHIIAITLSSFLLLSGFLLLVAIYMGLKDPKMLLGVEGILVLLTVFSTFIFANINHFLVTVHVLLILMLVMIVVHQFQNYSKHKSVNALLVFIGMGALFLAHISYFLIPYVDIRFYAVGHGLQLFGYMMLLANMLLVFKK